MSWVTPEQFATQVIQNVCELSDYTSPDDQPDLLQCTVKELESCVIRAFEHFDNTNRTEVMNPPASAAQGAEARNLNMVQRHGTGAVPQGMEAQATRPSAAPTIGDPCPSCAGRIGQSGYNYRCANCGWLGPRVEWAP